MHPDASEAQIEAVARSLRKAHYTELALKSAQARRIKSQEEKTAKRRRAMEELAQYRDSKSGRNAA